MWRLVKTNLLSSSLLFSELIKWQSCSERVPLPTGMMWMPLYLYHWLYEYFYLGVWNRTPGFRWYWCSCPRKATVWCSLHHISITRFKNTTVKLLRYIYFNLCCQQLFLLRSFLAIPSENSISNTSNSFNLSSLPRVETDLVLEHYVLWITKGASETLIIISLLRFKYICFWTRGVVLKMSYYSFHPHSL